MISWFALPGKSCGQSIRTCIRKTTGQTTLKSEKCFFYSRTISIFERFFKDKIMANIQNDTKKGRLVILSGPSGVGKGPLTKTLFIYMDSIGKKIVKHVLYTDRAMRPGEVDGVTYHYKTTDELIKLDSRGKINVFQVLKQRQGIDMEELRKQLADNDLVFLEIFYERVPEIIANCKDLASSIEHVFLTPLSEEDFEKLGCGEDQSKRAIAIQAVMLTKLTNRNTEDPETIWKRVKSACEEINNYTGKTETMLVNHYGEDVAPLWEKLQLLLINSPGGLMKALEDVELKSPAKTFNEFLKKIGCSYVKLPNGE
jgi:guanylate kinase